MVSDVTDQIEDELSAALAEPVGALLGLDLGEMVRQRISDLAPLIAHQLAQEDDDRLAAETVVDVLSALGEPDPEWWQTPVGRLCARSLGHDDAEAVTRSMAAAMLGVHPGTVAQLVHRGTLERHPDGGIRRSSVLARIGAR